MSNETRRTISIYLNNSPAIKKLNELEAKFNDEKKALRKLKEGSDEWVAALKKLEGAGKSLVDYRTKLDITGLSLQQLNKEAKNLRAMRDYIAPGTQELIKLNNQLEEVEKRQNLLKNKKETGTWASIKNVAIGSGLGTVSGNLALTAFNGLVNAIPNAIQKNTELADSQADVMRYTGLTKTQVEVLAKEFKKFDTRTPQAELMKLAGEAGKLNITGSANIRNFVKEADQIRVALGDDLGDDAIVMIAKLNNLWGTDKVYGYGKALTKAGSALNSLGAAGVATESYIVDATGRLGGMAAQAGISQTQVMGLAASMEELAITSEVGTTAVNMLWSDLYSNTEHYAKVAKMNVKDFAKLLKEDANEAFLKVLQGLNGTSQGLEGLVKQLDQAGIDGTRATAVFAGMAKNTDLIREKQALANTEFTKGTSIINEFNTKNENLAGSWEKLVKIWDRIWTSSTITKGVNVLVGVFENLFNIKNKLSDQTHAEMMDLNMYRTKIMDVNTSQADRVKLIKELQQMYPDYLSNLDAEKVSNDALATAIENVNKKLLVKKMVATKMEDLQPTIEKMDDLQTRLIEKRAKLQMLLASFATDRKGVLKTMFDSGISGVNVNTLTEEQVKKIDAQIKYMQSKGEDISKIGLAVAKSINESPKTSGNVIPGGGIAKILTNFWDEVGPYGTVSKLYDQAKANVDKQIKEVTDMESRLTDSLNISDPIAAVITPPDEKKKADGGDDKDKADKKEKTAKEYDLLLDQYKDLNQRLIDTRIHYRMQLETEEEKELQGIRDKYDDMEDANVDLWNKLQANRDSALKDEIAARKEGNTKLANDYHQQAIKLQDQMILVDEQMKKIAYQREEDITNKKKEHLEKRAKIAKEEADKDAAARAEAKERIFLATGNALAIEIYQMNKHYDELIALAKRYGMDTVALENSRSNALGKIMRGQLADAISMAEQMVGQLNSMTGFVNQAIANRDQADLQRYTKQQEERKRKLADRLKVGFITQVQYDKAIANMEAEAVEREGKLRMEAFKREQSTAIIQAIINTALGVTRAYATMIDPISGSIMAGFIAATGAAQIAAIASQAPPEYGKGGYLLSDDLPKHSQGGLAVVDQYGRKHAEVEGGEGIIPAKYAKKYKPLVDRMIRGENIGQANGQRRMPRISVASMQQAAQQSAGGYMGRNTRMQDTGIVVAQIEAIDKLTKAIAKMSPANSTAQGNVKLVYTDWLRDTAKFEAVKNVTKLAYSKK